MEIRPEEMAKLHCLHALFAAAAGHDAALTQHIKSAIDYSLTGTLDTSAPLEQFAVAALKLFEDQEKYTPSYGLRQIDLRQRHYDPLWLREELISALKALAGYEKALLLIVGLRIALCPGGHYWTRRLREEHLAARAYIDELAAQWTTPNCHLSILYL